MSDAVFDRQALGLAHALAEQVAAAGEAMGLPFVAISADISSPEPMLGVDERPLAETTFRWLDPEFRYWEDRGLALRATFVHAARICAEPFYFRAGRFGSWRPSAALQAINTQGVIQDFGVGSAIVAPVYLPGGVIGAVVWASPDESLPVDTIFGARAGELHVLALKCIATYHDAWHPAGVRPAARLTRREIQCLKYAAAGQTDADIAGTMQISVPTVRFHMTNAWRKLEVVGRTRAIHQAAALGYIGAVETGDG